MKNPSNKYIEDIVKQKIDKDEKLVDAIMDTLSVGKESAYRRIRGEVPYTFEDAMKIATKYNFSIDSIIGNNKNGAALITTDIIDLGNLESSYLSYLSSLTKLFQDLKKYKNPTAYLAFNLIPYGFYASYYNLCKFRLYKWVRQMDYSGHPKTFNDIEFPDDIWCMHLEMVKSFFSLPDISFIFNKDLFERQVQDILLYVQLGLVDNENLGLLKNELLHLLQDIEEMINTRLNDQTKRTIYISNVSFESSYMYFEADDYQASLLRLFGISTITTHDKWICLQQKQWIESLKRYSTLISVSGGVDRFAFLNKQREYINMLQP